MLILVSYDIPDDRRRTRLAHRLKDFGVRVQYSVFECRVDEEQLAHLRLCIEKMIDAGEDGVRLYRLCAECARQIEVQGVGIVQENPEIYIA